MGKKLNKHAENLEDELVAALLESAKVLGRRRQVPKSVWAGMVERWWLGQRSLKSNAPMKAKIIATYLSCGENRGYSKSYI